MVIKVFRYSSPRPEAANCRCSIKAVLKSFEKFTGIHLYRSLFLD